MIIFKKVDASQALRSHNKEEKQVFARREAGAFNPVKEPRRQLVTEKVSTQTF